MGGLPQKIPNSLKEYNMSLTITYCGRWNFLPKASSLAAELKEELDLEAELIKGDNGIFEVIYNGELVFSKKEVDRFPNPLEVTEILQTKM